MKTTNHKFQPAMAMNAKKLKISVVKVFFSIGMGMAMFGTSIFPAQADGSGTVKTLHGHVPAIVQQLKPNGNVPANQILNLAVGLPLRNTNELANLLQQIYDPGSTNYHRYLSPSEFTERFGPTKQDYRIVENFARVSGLTVTATHPNRMLLDVSGKASDIEKAFHVTLHTYKHPTENRDFFAPNVEPSVNVGLPILDISGLDSLRRPYSNYRIKSASNLAKPATSSMQTQPSATTGSGPSGNYMGDDFRNAYVPGASLNGSGQMVALVQFDGYLESDINQYETLTGRTNIPLKNVLIDGFDGLPTGNGGEVEVSLDIEMVISMAPALSQVIVYEGNPNNFHPNDVLNQIATDNLARQASSSWTWTGGPSATTDQILQEMAIQGQTYLQCSTDFDAYPPGLADSPLFYGTPADSPYVTSVGGTTLTMNGAGVSYASETVWNWGVRYGPAGDGEGSSGGYSSYYSIPNWQTNINMTARGGSSTTRNFPDVAMTGDDTLVIADGGVQYIGVGGTSIATPLWGGFMALVNQQATNSGLPSIGFASPALYAIASGSNYTNCFHDTTTGNNTWSGSPNLFYATNNYDLCTGLGTPNGTNLINALTGSSTTTNPVIVHISPPPPPYGSTLAAINGSNPNGAWQLFVQDDSPQNVGIISNGWILNLTFGSPVGDSANLQLLMSASQSSVIAGNTFTYTLSVTNYGPSTSSNVLVADTLPLGIVVVGNNSSAGSVTRNGQVLTWVLGTLAPSAGAQLQIDVETPYTGSLFNYAQVSATTSDPNTADNFASVTVNSTVATPPALSGAYVGTGGAFQFTVSGNAGVTNVIQASTNLVNWTTIYTNVSPFTFTNTDSANYPIRFYRAVTAP